MQERRSSRMRLSPRVPLECQRVTLTPSSDNTESLTIGGWHGYHDASHHRAIGRSYFRRWLVRPQALVLIGTKRLRCS
jgi:hypothetical protein